jgi:metal-responsive CopG/Arc/MetJ family transcriptional regulator
MPAKPVQISIDSELLDRIDADPEARAEGRSAFVRAAVERYLAAKARLRVDASIRAAYARGAAKALAETAVLMDAQEWPAD